MQLCFAHLSQSRCCDHRGGQVCSGALCILTKRETDESDWTERVGVMSSVDAWLTRNRQRAQAPVVEEVHIACPTWIQARELSSHAEGFEGVVGCTTR